MEHLPDHLKKYIVQQNYERYTPIDQAVWRYILRQLTKFLSENAHESYLDGLKKTGISIEEIPHIENISASLEKFGWRALPVSGFIPPAAFMELQSLSLLPIACDMRSIDHLLYTPAPDIVHEAAGHAPILVNEKYAEYLKQYAQVAKKAIISKQDLDQYEAIRRLSDLKENPSSTAADILTAEENLKNITSKITEISEASELSRMNWWTAEYGLIRSGTDIKIFGAGLLSSVGESRWCLSDQVKKIPLTADCVKQSYDITEPQPQLFVTDSFEHLSQVLEEFSKTMAYRQGGLFALQKILNAQTVNTVQFNNDLQISGVLKSFKTDSAKSISYLQFSGPSQLCFKDQEIEGHDCSYHKDGYGTPVGELQHFNPQLLVLNEKLELKYKSGVFVQGLLKKILKLNSDAYILSFEQATCKMNDEILFKPEWGIFDVIIAETVKSCFGGPADRKAYGDLDDFVASRVVSNKPTEQQFMLFSFYQEVREFRQSSKSNENQFKELFLKITHSAENEWLLFIELIEIIYLKKLNSDLLKIILFHLNQIKMKNPKLKDLIEDGLRLAENQKDATN